MVEKGLNKQTRALYLMGLKCAKGRLRLKE